MFKKLLLASILSVASAPLLAADYYVVVPAKSKESAGPAVVLALNAVPLPAGMVAEVYPGFDFNTALAVTGDPNFASAGVTWSLYSGELPAGLTLNADGTVSGIPTAAQSSAFHVRATYNNKRGEQAYEIIVGEITVALAAATPPGGEVGVVYSYDLRPLLSLSGKAGLDPSQTVWSVVGGSLPAGLTLSGQGVIAGTPTIETAPRQVTVRAVYQSGAGERGYQFQVATPAIEVRAYSGDPMVNGVWFTGYGCQFLWEGLFNFATEMVGMGSVSSCYVDHGGYRYRPVGPVRLSVWSAYIGTTYMYDISREKL